MKDIKLNTPYKKIQYWVSWVVFILLGMLWAWFVAIGLATYGKVTSNDVDSKKGVLNKTWQKFVYIYGMVMTYIILLIWALVLIGFI